MSHLSVNVSAGVCHTYETSWLSKPFKKWFWRLGIFGNLSWRQTNDFTKEKTKFDKWNNKNKV